MAPPVPGLATLYPLEVSRSSFLGIVLQQQWSVPARPATCPPLPISATLAPAALQRWDLAVTATSSCALWPDNQLGKHERGSSVVCRGLKMDDKYPRRQLTPEEAEQERMKKARRLRKRVRSDLQGPEGAWRQDWWRPKRAENDPEEDDSNPAVASERRMRRDKKLPVMNPKALGGGTYGGQFTKNKRKRKTAVDTADFARLVTERAQGMPAAAALDLQSLPRVGSVQQSVTRDAKDIKTRMSWYLESIGVDLGKVDVNQVPGVAEDQEMKVEYLQRLGLQEEQVARIIEEWPQLLRCSLSRNIKPVAEYLMSDWVGLRGELLLSFLSSYPQVLYMSVEMGIKPVLDWMRGVGLHRGEARHVLLRFPQILEGRIDGTMSGCVAFLVSVGVPLEAVKSVVFGCPEILLCSIRQVLKPRIELLVRELAMTEEEVVRLLLDKPQLLKCDLVEAYRNLITLLEQEAGLSHFVNPRQLFKHSSLGGVSERSTCLHEKLALLKGLNMGVADLGKVLSGNPSILAHEVAALEGRIECLLRAGFTSQQVTGMITRCPKLLNSSQEVLEAKTAHLLSELRCSLDEAVDFPDYFLCDLDHIRQRHMQLQGTGVLEVSLHQLCSLEKGLPKRGTSLTGSTSYGSGSAEALAPQNGANDRRHESRTKDRRKLVAKPISLPINYHIDVKLERLKLHSKVKPNVKQR